MSNSVSAPFRPGPPPIQIAALRAISGARVVAVILLLSIAVCAFLAWLVYFRARSAYRPQAIASLPALNAALNALSAVFLIGGYRAIRRANVSLHVRFMLGALASSALFFISYVVYHYYHGDTKFAGQGAVRPVYFFILVTHIGLSVVVVPLILTTFYLALGGKFRLHRTVAKVTLPVWLYVSLTGVVIFIMLKIFSPSS